MPSLEKILHEIENLSLIISIPQLISAPISVILISLLSPGPTPNDVIEIIDFLVISFPLTLAVAVIVLLMRTNQAAIALYIGAVVGAALLSNLLHQILSTAFPSVDVSRAYHEAMEAGGTSAYHGAGTLLSFAFKIISLYWQKFGIILFLQSCAIGIYAGVKYYKKTAVTPY